MSPGAAPSISQVNKAGKTIRRFLRGDDTDRDKFGHALDTLLGHRAAHQRPLTSANMGLRSVVGTVGCTSPDVSQRLKRVPTIVNKLVREPTLALSRMQDIGGCRAVLESVEEVYRVRDRILRNKPRSIITDYIVDPKPDGYRGIHAVVTYQERQIELQLRTRAMHQWAVTIEALTGIYGKDFKSGDGPQEVLDLMSAISRAMAADEMGEPVSASLAADIERARVAAAPFLTGGRT